MKAKNELEYLAMIVQDFIATQPRSVQIALAERAQHCVSQIEQALSEPSDPAEPADAKTPPTGP